MLLTNISRDEVEGIEVGKVVARVQVDSLQKSHYHPQPKDHQVVAQEKDPNKKACAYAWGGTMRQGRDVALSHSVVTTVTRLSVSEPHTGESALHTWCMQFLCGRSYHLFQIRNGVQI